jgi:hypothetical protein
MLAKNGSCFAPASHSAEEQKRAHDELGFRLLQLREERVRVETGLGAERGPSSPDSVLVLVGWLLL